MTTENKVYNKVMSKVDYALTITYKHLHCKTPKGMFKETAPYLTKLLNRSTEFSLYCEFRHNTGALHWHGVIRIIDHIKWHKQTLPSLKSLGFICIKMIGKTHDLNRRYKDAMEGWINYCSKEIEIAKGLLGDFFPLTKVIEFKKKDLKTGHIMDDYILNAEVSVEQETRQDDREGTGQTKEESSKE